ALCHALSRGATAVVRIAHMPSHPWTVLSVSTLQLAFGTAPGSAGCYSCNICIATTNHSECRALFLSA
ncbi:unnamed protein product, partial [Ectocarpus sp. 8 AP-2014]